MVKEHSQPSLTTIEGKYVSSTVGPALAGALTEIVEKRPFDPIEFLANYLYKHAENEKQRKRDLDLKNKIEQLRLEDEQNRLRQEEMKRELEAIELAEERIRKDKEAEERARREAEELAKRKADLANIPPPLPQVKEEDEYPIVEFGETRLHQEASVRGSNLIQLIKEESISLAARNSQYQTAREIAEKAEIQENVKQLDEFVCELLANEDYKALNDLVINGYHSIPEIVEANLGNAEALEARDMKQQAAEVFHVIPEIMEKIQKLKECIEKNDLRLLQMVLDRKPLAFFRDQQGKSSVHLAIGKLHFDIAIYLLEKYPLIGKMNDCHGKYPVDYLEALDKSVLNEAQQQQYDHLLNLSKSA